MKLNLYHPPLSAAGSEERAVGVSNAPSAWYGGTECVIREPREQCLPSLPQDSLQRFFGDLDRIKALVLDNESVDAHIAISYQRTSATSARLLASASNAI